MRVALYARTAVREGKPSSSIVQQLERLRQYVAAQGWALPEGNVFVDDGYSGSTLDRPGLDRLRARAKLGLLDCAWLNEPHRLSRNYGQARLLWEELKSNGCQVRCLDEVMSWPLSKRALLRGHLQDPGGNGNGSRNRYTVDGLAMLWSTFGEWGGEWSGAWGLL